MNLKYRRNQGFTLIELLVVISIIGMLSSIVLAAVGSVKSKAVASRIQVETNQIRIALVTAQNPNGTLSSAYVTPSTYTCFTNATLNDPQSLAIANDIATQNGGSVATATDVPAYFGNSTPMKSFSIFTDSNTGAICLSSGFPAVPTRFAVYSAFGSNGVLTGYYCSDSSGKTTTGTVASDATSWNTFWNNINNASASTRGTCM